MPQHPITYFDGAKSIPLQALPDAAWTYLTGKGQSDELSTRQAFRTVPWVYRAIDIRAKAVSRMPFAIYRGESKDDVKDDPQYRWLTRRLKRLLYQTEASFCVDGASYWIYETNRFGMNHQLRWLLSTTITPDTAKGAGLAGFKRRIGQREVDLSLDQVVYFWLPSIEHELGPGTAPAVATLRSAGVLHNLDIFLEGFFKRGAIKATLLTIEGNPGKPEMDKLEAWWKRLLGGVRNAFETVAIKSTVKPVIIGDSLKETVNKELTNQERENVSTGMGVPHSLMFSNAANFATSQQDVINFYEQTIIPDCELIEDDLNEQRLEKMGLRIKFLPKRLEAFQRAELEKADSVRKVVGKPVLTVNEGRELLDYEPLDEEEDEADEVAPAPAQVPGQAPDDGDDEDDDDDAAAAKGIELAELERRADLERYTRKALKALRAERSPAVKFESDALAPEELAHIHGQLQLATSAGDVAAAFKKAGPLTDEEAELYTAILKVLKKHRTLLGAEIWNGAGEVNLTALSEELRTALYQSIADVMLRHATELAEAIGPDFDPAVFQSAAADWARSYTFELVDGIRAKTRTLLRGAIADFQTTAGMTRGELEARIAPAFGEARAEVIAITEVTRATSASTRHYQQLLAEAGIDMERVNRTNKDDLVCAVCGPLNNKPESEWPNEEGSPWHPRCRCRPTLRRKKAPTA